VVFPDEKTYNDYIVSGGTLDLDDWRRDNVNQLVKRLNDGIHEANPWVKFSISPFGIYRAGINRSLEIDNRQKFLYFLSSNKGHEEGMPAPIAGFDQYSQIYCDPKKWMQEGWVDVLIPQLYWRIDPPAQSYPILLDWWVATPQNPHLRHVYAGNYLTRIDIDGWPWYEIRAQVRPFFCFSVHAIKTRLHIYYRLTFLENLPTKIVDLGEMFNLVLKCSGMILEALLANSRPLYTHFQLSNLFIPGFLMKHTPRLKICFQLFTKLLQAFQSMYQWKRQML
jgi:hypothetical protein